MIRAQELEQEVRRCTQAIRDVFAVDGDLDEAAVVALHEQLINCVLAVNDRLRRCDALLRAGLRQEAIQECESPPNLLDLLNELDLPEWDAWADYVKQFGFPPQPALLHETAAELNDAYTQSQKLEGLLRKQRLLALARSPLSNRLALLRTIAQRDPGNRVWGEDVQSYEVARLREIENEATRFAAARNVRGLSLLQSELEGVTWHMSPSSKLVERVSGAHRALVVEEARQKLDELARTIDSAYSEGSAERLTELRERWDRLAVRAKLVPGDPLTDRVRPAFDWLSTIEADQERQEAYRRAVADLETALDDESSKPAELTRLMSAVERFDEPIPKTLVNRYDDRIESARVADRRRAILILATSVAAIALIGAGVAFLTFRQIRLHEIAEFRRGLETDLESKSFGRALDRFAAESKTRAYLATDDGVLHAVSRLEAGSEAERVRARRFDAHLAAASAAGEAGTWEGLAQADAELEEARKIAAESERLRLNETIRIVQRTRDRLQGATDEAFAAALAPFLETLGKVDRLTTVEVEEALATLKALRQTPRVSPTALGAAKLDVALKKLEGRKATLRERSLLESNVDRIAMAVGSAEDYGRAIEAYRKLDGVSERSADFARTLELDVPALHRIDAWNAAAAGWNGVNLLSVSDPADALAKLAALKPFAEFEGVADALPAEEWLETIDERRAARDRVEGVLASEWMNLEGLRTLDGGYVLCEDPSQAPPGPGAFLQVFVSANPSLRSEKTYVRRDEVLGGELKHIPSPQKEFASELRDALQKGYAFELEACVVLEKLVNKKEMDPILKLQLLDVLTEPLTQASPFLREGLRPFEEQVKRMVRDTESLTRRDLASLDWLNKAPSSEEASARSAIETSLIVLQESSPAAAYRSAVDPAFRRTILEKAPLKTYAWAGALIKADDGSWTVRTPRSDYLPDGPLLGYDATVESKHPFVPLGSISSGAVTIDAGAAAAYEGRPVFLPARS